MRFPTIGQYIESLANPQGLFRTLRDVMPLRNPYGELRLHAGNFSVIFKVGLPVQEEALSGMTGMGHYAMKCYTRPCGRIGRICTAVEALDAPYLVRCRYLPEELYVYDEYERGAYFPVVLSEWIEGETLGRHVARLCGAGDREALSLLAGRFDCMALWLLQQPYAHGDIKPDNILVEPSGELRLIDLDGMFLPQFAGERSVVLGSPACQHPLRDERCFDRNIDDYPLATLSLSLHALAADPGLYDRYNDRENLILNAAEVVAGTSGLFAELGRNWIDAGEGELAALWRALHAPVPAVAGLGAVFRALTGDRALELLAGYDVVEDGDRACALICHGGRYGYADLDRGVWTVYPLWEEAQPCSEGIAMVRGGGCWRAIDATGRILSRFPEYTEVMPLREGRARICREGLYGFIDAGGRESVAPVYPFAGAFREGRAKVRLQEDYFYIDRDGCKIGE